MSRGPNEEPAAAACEPDRNSALETDLTRLRELAIGGDLNAAQDMMLRFAPYARGVLREFRLQEAELEDCLQELWGKVFLDDMLALRRWRGEGPLRTYLATIARRIVLDLVRRRKAFGTAAEQGPEPQQEPVHGDVLSDGDPFAVMEAAQGRRLIGRGLALLSPGHRNVLVLRYYCDLKHREIGELMGIPTAQVGITLQRAEQALARRLRTLGSEKA